MTEEQGSNNGRSLFFWRPNRIEESFSKTGPILTVKQRITLLINPPKDTHFLGGIPLKYEYFLGLGRLEYLCPSKLANVGIFWSTNYS